jgi:hypothetical protein
MTTHLHVLAVLTLGLGLAGYVLGVFDAYPGRELSLVLAMVGVTLVLVGGLGGSIE